MCNCIRKHPGFACRSDGCDCHGDALGTSVEHTVSEGKSQNVRKELVVQEGDSIQVVARRLVYNYVKGQLEVTDTDVIFGLEDVYIVWFTFVLGNWKAMISTTLPDGMYYEVTYNGVKDEFYLDAYKKFHHVVIPA